MNIKLPMFREHRINWFVRIPFLMRLLWFFIPTHETLYRGTLYQGGHDHDWRRMKFKTWRGVTWVIKDERVTFADGRFYAG